MLNNIVILLQGNVHYKIIKICDLGLIVYMFFSALSTSIYFEIDIKENIAKRSNNSCNRARGN